VKLDHTYILPIIFALIVHILVAFIFMSEWQGDSQRTPPVQLKQRVEATLIDLDSLLAQQKKIDTTADKKAADKKAADKKAADKKAVDKKAADKKAADKKAADKKAADKKAADKKAADEKAADKKAADKKAADKKAADEKAADKKAADKKAADKKAADKKAADKKAADKKTADKKAADKKVADKKVADKKVADKKTADKQAADKKTADKQAADKQAADKKVADKKVAEQKAAQQLAEVQQALDSLLDNEEMQTQALAQQATNGQAVASAIHYIRDEIRQRWVRPANARTGMVVELVIQLVPTGEIIHIEISYRDASATDAFVSSVDKAVRKVGRFDKLSQLNPVLFDANFRKFTLKFKPEDLRL
jgi:colicin import membrane protein